MASSVIITVWLPCKLDKISQSHAAHSLIFYGKKNPAVWSAGSPITTIGYILKICSDSNDKVSPGGRKARREVAVVPIQDIFDSKL